MKQYYVLPLKGTVLRLVPLEGAAENPLGPPDLAELLSLVGGVSSDSTEGDIAMESINYDIENETVEVVIEASPELHEALQRLSPRFKQIAKERGWKLDKSRLPKCK